MALSDSHNRRHSLEILPGHKYDPVNYLRVDLNTAGVRRKKSYSRVEDARKTGEDNLYENPTVIQPIGKYLPQVVRQSPIDIHLSHTVYDPRLEKNPLTVSYHQKVEKFCKLRNTGNTWKLRVGDDRFRLTGGPLNASFQLDQVHAHWGPNNVTGSEHTVNRYHYAGELHFVHWNTSMCPDIGCAAARPDGLAVIGVFLKLGKPHPEIQKLTEAMQEIHYAGQETDLDSKKINIRNLMPQDISQYWTYDGSLTTTPYDDCVIWIVLKKEIEVSREQMEAMRSMVEFQEGECAPSSHPACGNMVHNYRETQAQSRVKVRSSFRSNVDYF